MPIVPHPDLLSHWKRHTGSCTAQVQHSADVEHARDGLVRAAAALRRIPHPEEPDDCLPSFVSEVRDADDGPLITFDIADAEAYDGLVEQVLEAVLTALASAGTDGVLAWPGAPPLAEAAERRARVRLTEPEAPLVVQGLASEFADQRLLLNTSLPIERSLRGVVLEVAPVSGEVRILDSDRTSLLSVFVFDDHRMALVDNEIGSYDGFVPGGGMMSGSSAATSNGPNKPASASSHLPARVSMRRWIRGGSSNIG